TQTVSGNLTGSTVNYVSGVSYSAHNEPVSYLYGNGLQRTASYNARLQLQEFTDRDTVHGFGCGVSPTPYTGASKWDLDVQLYWGTGSTQTASNNGNLYLQSIDTCNGANYWTEAGFTQKYTYDNLNRLNTFADYTSTSTNPDNTRSFSYDAFGNMAYSYAGDVLPAGGAPVLSGSNSVATLYDPNTNRIRGVHYDTAGNDLDLGPGCNNCISYDAENRVTGYSATRSTYVYDGDGRRIQKLNGTSLNVTEVYDALGRLAAEYWSTSGTAACTTCYLSWDHLGSVRMVTGDSGNLVARHDFFPFGEEVMAGSAGRPTNGLFGAADSLDLRFTGKERDTDASGNATGLDYFGARYYGSALGRFMSPDEPLQDQDPENPQTWNLYSYGRNNPLNGIDPTGENWWTDFWQSVGNCFRFGSCHTTDYIADQRLTRFVSSLQINGQSLTPAEQETLKAELKKNDQGQQLSSSQVIQEVDTLNNSLPHVKQDDNSAMPPLGTVQGPLTKDSTRFAQKNGINSSSANSREALLNLDSRVDDFIGKYRLARVRAEMPGQYLNMTVRDALASGDSTVRKLLLDSRFAK
ncbi:MAG: RHS repeat-associated core domain-containing protein, partial [Acidobacteriaceae bacterium]|nr:RHS repeat-associated core domain-containing protein [Acidobacteriaceae bacterium]